MQEEAISLGHQDAGLVDYVELLDTRGDKARFYENKRLPVDCFIRLVKTGVVRRSGDRKAERSV